MRKPFTLKEYLAHPEWKVETVLKEPVTIVKTDLRCEDGNILCYYFDGKEEIAYVTTGSDLFLITPEPELTEFEQALIDLIADWGDSVEHFPSEFVKKRSHILLSLAKDQLRKDGFIVEKHNELFDKCVKNIDDKLLATMQVEYGCHVLVRNGHRHAELGWQQFQKVAQKFIDMGKAEALKDLPRWRKEPGEMELVAYGIIGDGFLSQENPRVYLNGHTIDLYSLEKLPGFKENEE